MNAFKRFGFSVGCIVAAGWLTLLQAGVPGEVVRISINRLRVMNANNFLKLQSKQLPWDVQIGQLTVRVPVELQQNYPVGLRQALSAGPINPLYFPKTALINDRKIAQSLQHFADNAARFEKNKVAILSSLKSDVFDGAIPYKQFLPPSEQIDYLYIGEVHGQPRVQQEIVSFITALTEIYPERKIYVATEFLPEEPVVVQPDKSCDFHRDVPLRIVQNEDELANLLPDEQTALPELTELLNHHIALVGLEPQLRMIEKIIRETTHIDEDFMWEHISRWYENYGISEAGMVYRNQIWRDHIAQLRAYDPSALIVVYGGATHVGYQHPFSVPRLVNRPKQFVTFFTTPSFIDKLNPLFGSMREDAPLQQQFHQTSHSKMITHWQKPSPFKTILGGDFTVIVHK